MYRHFLDCCEKLGIKDAVQAIDRMLVLDHIILNEDSAFWGCINLTSVDIPDSVTSIGDGAFWGCTNLKSISVSKNTKIGEDAIPEGVIIEYR